MKNIGYFGFEPGLTDGDEKSSTGNSHWLKRLIRELQENKMNFINASVGEKSMRLQSRLDALDHSDVFVFSWRWLMDEKRYPMRNAAFYAQNEALDYGYRNSIPCIIHDSDMMQDDIVDFVRDINPDAILTMPAFYPRKGFKTLFFPNPFERAKYVPLRFRKYGISYVGNNYMRYDQMKKTFALLSGKYDINVWGNWMSKAIEADAVEAITNDFPGVKFFDKIGQSQIQGILGDSKVTFQFAKDIYCEHGFITPRLFESTSSNCVTIFPDEFRLPDELEDIFRGFDIDQIINDELYYKEILESQVEVADEIDGINVWIELLKSL